MVVETYVGSPLSVDELISKKLICLMCLTIY